MNERQRDLFLWQWSQRRQRGAATVARRGALVGAAGGLLFTVLMLGGMGPPSMAGQTGLSTLIPHLERAALLLLLTVPTLACIAAWKAWRFFALHEHMFHTMLQSGARVPTQAPVLRPMDRWPQVAVGVAVLLITGFIGALVWAHARGLL